MSRDKILKNIKKNISKRVALKDIDFEVISFEDPLSQFIKNFQAAAGEIVTTIPQNTKLLKAEYGIAENGAILLQEIDTPLDFTFYEEITILLNKNNILNNMHEAYKKLHIDRFALFMAGPSKTADIEQSLVIGAHGAKRVYLVLEP